jgi:hypothetical protein
MPCCAGQVISLTPDGDEQAIRCTQEAVEHGRLCVYHSKVEAGLCEPIWTDDSCTGYDAGIRRVEDYETGHVLVKR